jgi:ATP synthase protein I
MKNSVTKKTSRMMASRQRPKERLWRGFASFGLVGWTIALPTFLGAALGRFLDRHYSSAHSWTLSLLVAGLVLGCAAAWIWIEGEEKRIKETQNGAEKDSKGPHKHHEGENK